MAPLDGASVTISGLEGRPELNGRRGVALGFNDATNRYNVQLDGGEAVALKPHNLQRTAGTHAHAAAGGHAGGAHAHAAAGAAGAAAGAAARADFALPAGLEPQHVALAAAAVLVYFLRWSLTSAALLCGLGYVAHGAARREGGPLRAARDLLTRVTDGIERLTGQRLSQAQAAFLMLAVVALVYRFWLMPTAGGRGGSSGSSYSSSSQSSSGTPGGRADRYRQERARRRASEGYDGEYADEGHGGGGWSGLGSGFDLSFMFGAAMLGNMVWRMGGGGRPGGWGVGTFVTGLRNMDFFQMMMFMNLVQNVLGGGRRRGGMGMGGMGMGRRRGMFY